VKLCFQRANYALLYSHIEKWQSIGGLTKLIGNRIRKLREDKGLNQLELSKLLNIGNSTLSQYESGQRTPSDDIKIKLSKIFDVSIDYLIGNSNIKNPYNHIETIAAHHDSEEWTEKELEEIEKFKEFVRMKRNNK